MKNILANSKMTNITAPEYMSTPRRKSMMAISFLEKGTV